MKVSFFFYFSLLSFFIFGQVDTNKKESFHPHVVGNGHFKRNSQSFSKALSRKSIQNQSASSRNKCLEIRKKESLRVYLSKLDNACLEHYWNAYTLLDAELFSDSRIEEGAEIFNKLAPALEVFNGSAEQQTLTKNILFYFRLIVAAGENLPSSRAATIAKRILSRSNTQYLGTPLKVYASSFLDESSTFYSNDPQTVLLYTELIEHFIGLLDWSLYYGALREFAPHAAKVFGGYKHLVLEVKDGVPVPNTGVEISDRNFKVRWVLGLIINYLSRGFWQERYIKNFPIEGIKTIGFFANSPYFAEVDRAWISSNTAWALRGIINFAKKPSDSVLFARFVAAREVMERSLEVHSPENNGGVYTSSYIWTSYALAIASSNSGCFEKSDGTLHCLQNEREKISKYAFPNTQTYDEGRVIWKTPFGHEKVNKLYRKAMDVERAIESLFEKLNLHPVHTGEPDEGIEYIIFRNSREYWDFMPILFNGNGLGSGFYWEAGSKIFTYERNFINSSNPDEFGEWSSLSEIIAHESAHYKLAKLVIRGVFGDSFYENGRLAAFEEGIAQFFTGANWTGKNVDTPHIKLVDFFVLGLNKGIPIFPYENILTLGYGYGTRLYVNAGLLFASGVKQELESSNNTKPFSKIVMAANSGDAKEYEAIRNDISSSDFNKTYFENYVSTLAKLGYEGSPEDWTVYFGEKENEQCRQYVFGEKLEEEKRKLINISSSVDCLFTNSVFDDTNKTYRLKLSCSGPSSDIQNGFISTLLSDDYEIEKERRTHWVAQKEIEYTCLTTTGEVSVDRQGSFGQENEKDVLVVYPNPLKSGEQLNVLLKKGHEFFRYEIFHLNGQRVLEKNIGKGSSHFKIILRNINPGNYYIRFLGTQDLAIIKRFVIVD